MIEKISLALIDESGTVIPIEKTKPQNLEMKIEEITADAFSKICYRNNAIGDAEIRAAEKFQFALHLQNYLKELKENELA